jgi:hypothetical protein
MKSFLDSMRFGWLPDLPDGRDFEFVPKIARAKLPAAFDGTDAKVPVWDQRNIGSCVAHGTMGGFLHKHFERSPAAFDPSRLQVYYDARAMRGWEAADTGCFIRDAIKCLAKLGVGSATFWPYDTSKFAQKPPAECYGSAKAHQALRFRRIGTKADDIRSALVEKAWVVFGISVYDSMMTTEVARTGAIPMPKGKQRGGHCMVADSYNGKLAAGNNSWSTTWGNKGRFTIPFDYLTDRNLADDFWAIDLVEV